MEFALDRDGKRVHAQDADKREEYTCPVCGAKVIPRQGEVNSWHYAHLTPCEDDWEYDMSEWHRSWQEQFPKGNREIVLECDGEKHRADVLAYGYVLEFQHSPISAEEFNRRNAFYTKAGKKVIWIFDLIGEINAYRQQFRPPKLKCYDEWNRNNDNGGLWEWRYPKKCFKDYIPHEQKNIILFFQIADTDFSNEVDYYYIERVIWAPTYNFGKTSNFSRFKTSYYPGTKTEMLDWMKNKKL